MGSVVAHGETGKLTQGLNDQGVAFPVFRVWVDQNRVNGADHPHFLLVDRGFNFPFHKDGLFVSDLLTVINCHFERLVSLQHLNDN